MDDVIIVNRLPAWNVPGFSAREWNSKFLKANVILNSDVYDAVYPVHWGPLSLKFAFKGSEYYEIDNCRYRVTDGNFLLFNQGQCYASSVVSDTAVRSFTVNFCPEFKAKKFAELMTRDSKLLDNPDESVDDISFFSQLYSYDPVVAGEVFELKNFIDGLNYNSLYINEKLSVILEAIYQLNCSVLKETDGVDGERPSTRIETYRRLVKAKDYIDSNYMNEVSLEKLGIVSCMNQFHLLRKFKKFFNKTPHQYLMSVRLEEAKALLKKKKMPVTEVCLEVGYDDIASFSKLFKRKYGVSPDNYKNQN